MHAPWPHLFLLSACAGAGTEPGDGLVLESITHPDAGPDFGEEFAGAGDVNGDGYDDFLVSDFYNYHSRPVVGLFLGGPDRAFGVRRLLGVDQTFGASLAGLGDVDGDGLDDVAVGAWSDDRVSVVHWDPEGMKKINELENQGHVLAGPGNFSGGGLAVVAITDTQDDSRIRVCDGLGSAQDPRCLSVDTQGSAASLQGDIPQLRAVGDLTEDDRGDLVVLTNQQLVLIPGMSLEEG